MDLSYRYITNRFLPDKAIDLMDEAASRLRLEMNSVPEELDELERSIARYEIEKEALRRDGDREKENEMARISLTLLIREMKLRQPGFQRK